MICSICKKGETSVVDSRPTEDGTAIRRRRLCVCGARFTTFERVQFRELMVDVWFFTKEIFYFRNDFWHSSHTSDHYHFINITS